MTVIVNTTVISNFAVIGQLDILRRLFGSVMIARLSSSFGPLEVEVLP
ncbi:MAG: hypothetical protein JZU52_10320 [Lamprocystis purpurea]|nr:hypothetical protein [Lamprocystis purpurea]MBV5274010.1 hypothetical protein [Lamprocystis purpurea]